MNDGMDGKGLRLRAALDGRLTVVAVALAALVLVGGAVTYTAHAATETTTDTRTGVAAEYRGVYDHQATVTTASPLFDRGETLRNRTIYFNELTPVLNGSFTFEYDGRTGDPLSTSATLSLVVASVGGGDERPETYWREVRPLDAANATLAPGESLTLSFSANVTRVANESAQLDESIGGTPGEVALSVVTTVDAEGQVRGGTVDRTLRYELGLAPEEGVYRVDDPGAVTNQTSVTRTVSSTVDPGLLRSLGGPLLLVLGLVGLGGLGAARTTGRLALSDRERARLDYRRAREEYEEWITTASAAVPDGERERIDVDSLQGLVDLAIDCDRRVIEDPGGDTYRVVVDGVMYRYRAPADPGAAGVADPLARGDDRAPGGDEGLAAGDGAPADASEE